MTTSNLKNGNAHLTRTVHFQSTDITKRSSATLHLCLSFTCALKKTYKLWNTIFPHNDNCHQSCVHVPSQTLHPALFRQECHGMLTDMHMLPLTEKCWECNIKEGTCTHLMVIIIVWQHCPPQKYVTAQPKIFAAFQIVVVPCRICILSLATALTHD